MDLSAFEGVRLEPRPDFGACVAAPRRDEFTNGDSGSALGAGS
jgi:hypothetical protein